MDILDSILKWLPAAAIGLVVLALLVVLVLLSLTFLVALWEKQHVETYTPLLSGDRLEANPYYVVMNQLAAQSGYLPCGEYRANRNGLLSKVFVALWIAPDGRTVGVVGGGKVAGTRYRKTRLITRQRDGTTLVTIDDHGVTDLSGTSDTKVWLRADFVELVRVHETRIRTRTDFIEPFRKESVLQQMNQMEAERVERIVSLGRARYVDMGQTSWRHTITGAFGAAFGGFLRGIQTAEDQSDRQKLSRPGG